MDPRRSHLPSFDALAFFKGEMFEFLLQELFIPVQFKKSLKHDNNNSYKLSILFLKENFWSSINAQACRACA